MAHRGHPRTPEDTRGNARVAEDHLKTSDVKEDQPRLTEYFLTFFNVVKI